jgi:transmembrane sensor
MTSPKDPLGQDALLADAARWFAALDAGTARLADFEAWREHDPARAVAYARILAGWEQAQQQPAAGITKSYLSRRGWLRTAAVGAPLALLGAGLLTQPAEAWQHATTGVGETRRIALPDGSVIYLNTDSAVSWRFDRDAHALRLERGEIAVDVRLGGSMPLNAKGFEFSLSSGLFDARVTARGAELTLIDGAELNLRASGSEWRLRKHDTMVVEQGTQRIETRSMAHVVSQLAWRAGEIVFLDETVANATAEFNRHLTRKIVVDDPALAREKIGGRFELNRPDQFLAALALSLDARVVRSSTGISLTR